MPNYRPMRIVHVIRSLDPAEGGPPKIACCLAAAQASQGHDVHIFCYDRPHAADSTQAMLSTIPHRQLVHFHSVPRGSRVEQLLARNARHAIAQLLDHVKPDALHLHNVWDPILRVAASEAARRRVPYLIILNGMLDPWSLAQKPLKKKLALAMGYRTMLNRAAALHTGNTDEKQLIAPLNLAAPAVIIPNGIFLDEIDPLPPKGSFYAQYPQLQARPFILFLSRLHYKKGLDHLADAFAIVAASDPDVQLVVAGPDDGARQNFQSQIAQAGLTSRVHLVGPLYGPAKFAALADATCFCLPSRQEGFSIAIVEALACSLPVVITAACHFPEVADVGAGCVTPLDARQIAQSLLKVLRDPALRSQMGAAGRALVEQHLTWQKISEQCIAVYRQSATPQSLS